MHRITNCSWASLSFPTKMPLVCVATGRLSHFKSDTFLKTEKIIINPQCEKNMTRARKTICWKIFNINDEYGNKWPHAIRPFYCDYISALFVCVCVGEVSMVIYVVVCGARMNGWMIAISECRCESARKIKMLISVPHAYLNVRTHVCSFCLSEKQTIRYLAIAWVRPCREFRH